MAANDKQTNTQLPKDADSQAIQVLSLAERVSLTVSIGSPTRSAFPALSEIVRVAVDENAYILFGDVTVAASAANGHLMPAGVEYFRVQGDTHISVLAVGSAGVGTLSRIQ